MKISELKQPYRRMVEYLLSLNSIQKFSYGIYNIDKRGSVMELFCNELDKGNHPPITEEIKQHFPADFDFSDIDINIMEDKIILPTGDYVTRVNLSEAYTQLAKEGKFHELPSTCEFSEPVKLLVSNFYSSEKKEALIIGKLKNKFFEANIIGKIKGRYVDEGFYNYQVAQTINKPIDYKVGDVVEVETENFGTFYGMIHTINQRGVTITFGKQSGTLRTITDVKSIKKIK